MILKKKNEDKKLGSGAKVGADAQLNSSTMRYVIQQWKRFHASKAYFESGGAKKPVFFHRKEDANSTEKRMSLWLKYREPGDPQAQTSGKRSIRTVLQEIKNDLEKDGYKSVTKIFIPLQQIGKKHWTLLAITSNPSSPSANNAATVTATHYDSKGLLNSFRDAFSQGKHCVDDCIKEFSGCREGKLSLSKHTRTP